jgi:hypothetical protein
MNELCQAFNVVCIQESWHLSFKSITNEIIIPDKQYFHKLAIKTCKKGRPCGGLVFIVDDNIKCSASFPSDRIGVLKVGDTALIQVYLPFNDRSEFCCENFKNELIVLETCFNQIKQSYPNIVILGDFNCDFTNISENGINLIKLMRTLKIGLPLDISTDQDFEFTYWKIKSDQVITSWPDHVFSNICSKNISNVSLLPINNNFGDHRGIGLSLKIKSSSESNSLLIEKENKPKHFWGNGKKTELYSLAVSNTLKENASLYDNLCTCTASTAPTAVNEMNKFLTSNLVAEGIEQVTDKNPMNNKYKKKWFSPALQRIHINICLAYKIYKASNFSYEFKRKFYELKKQFRLQKRLLAKLKDENSH